MKRDMELIRELLLRLESLPLKPGRGEVVFSNSPSLQVDGFTEDQIKYHLHLIESSGLIETRGNIPTAGMVFWGLTWRGHDFLDSVRDPEIWKATKEAANKVGGLSLDMLGNLAKGFIKTQIAKHTGIEIDM
jgi:hypothetical protein